MSSMDNRVMEALSKEIDRTCTAGRGTDVFRDFGGLGAHI